MTAPTVADVAALLQRAADAGVTLAVAESLTAGAVCSALADVPGASRVLRGGVVAYATELKSAVLRVDPGLLAARGPVDPHVAAAMALGVRDLLGARIGLATTGVAGPATQHGHPVGTAHVAVTWSNGSDVPLDVEGSRIGVGDRCVIVRHLALRGDRGTVRHACVERVLELLRDVLVERPGSLGRWNS